MKTLLLLAPIACVAAVAAAAAFVPGVFAAETGRAGPSLAPQDCVCSIGVNLAAADAPASILRNCRCGSMQCVVHVGSGHLQCN